jgi:hypothetical protein
MRVTWSVSRDQTLHVCERRYYFQYLAAARINSRDRTLREIAFLKKLKNFPMWKGNAFHSFVAAYFREARRGAAPKLADLVDELRGRMKREWDFSSSKSFRSNPRAIDQKDGLALFEHEYDVGLGEQDFMKAIQDIEYWTCRFAAWARDNDLANSVRRAARVWVEPRPYGPKAPGFEMDGVQVLAKVDLAVLSPDGKFDIFDWKTGIPSSRPSRQIDQAEFQVSVYQLWPHLAFGHPMDSIGARLVYVATDPVRQQTFGIDRNLREYTLSLVRRSIARVLHFADLRGGKELSLEDLDFAAFEAACFRCPFKRLCQRALENEWI